MLRALQWWIRAVEGGFLEGRVTDSLSRELLMGLLRATPEQLAAVERILGVGGETRSGDGHLARAENKSPVTVDVARAAFALLVKLDAQGKHKSPSPLTVFRLYCVDGHSAAQVARKCRCAKGTVMSRLRFIEGVTNTKAEDFRVMSGHLQEMDDDLNASGAREIYRRGLANEGED